MSADISYTNEWQVYIKVVGVVVVGVALVAVVEQPHVADVEDFVVGSEEELREVGARLHQLRQPNHRGQVSHSSLQILPSQHHLCRVLLTH